MNSVRPLGFLLARSIVNGVKRAVTSPKRIIGLAFFALYYWNLFLRPFSSSKPVVLPSEVLRFEMPPIGSIDASVFGIVGFFSLMLMGSVLSYKGGFKAADVDVLFPTPVSPRVVLLFRIARDTLATLLLPLIFAFIGFRSASPFLGSLFKDYPKSGGDIVRACILAYLMVSLVWVCVGYAASLFVNRSDLDSDRYRKRINWGMALLIGSLAVYVAFRFRSDPSVETLIAVAHTPYVRVVLAPVTLATWLVMGLFQGQLLTAAAGFFGLALLIAVSLRIALTQVGWMYDQAAVRGFDSGTNLRDLQKKGDMMGIMAERARQGKVKHGRIARRIAEMRVRGPVALLWKEAILQARGSLSGLIAIGAFFLGLTVLMMWSMTNAFSQRQHGAIPAGWMLMAMQGMIVYVLCMASGQGGFIEFLRRVDVQKPLPFTPAVTVFWEVVAKAIAPTLLGTLAALVGVAIAPRVWPQALAGTIIAPSLAVLLTGVLLLVIVLFPDVEDPTQRMFRGLMLMLGIVVCGAFGAAVFAGGVVASNLSPVLLAPVTAAINLGIAVGLSVVAGGLYANYNPSE